MAVWLEQQLYGQGLDVLVLVLPATTPTPASGAEEWAEAWTEAWAAAAAAAVGGFGVGWAGTYTRTTKLFISTLQTGWKAE